MTMAGWVTDAEGELAFYSLVSGEVGRASSGAVAVCG
jgi:hypothetical protein